VAPELGRAGSQIEFGRAREVMTAAAFAEKSSLTIR
jgi:hypothetical protein